MLAELTAAHRAKVDADYRRYAIDNGNTRVEKLEREKIAPPIRPSEAEEPKPHRVGRDDQLKGQTRPAAAAAASLKRGETRHGPEDTAVANEFRDLPKGYESTPALKGDPYHPDSVTARSTANRELYGPTTRDRAAALGYTARVSAQKAPFDSHGQEAFTNGKNYITPDVDGHNVTDGWKMFNRRGARIGTYDSELNYVKE
ncbi:MAG: toxin C-terminal domain-containing protein [Trebonia sp.]